MDDQEFIMTNQELKEHFFLELVEIYPENEIQSFFHILIQHRLKLSRVQFALNYKATINKEDTVYFQKSIIDLKHYRPIQYIMGTTEFFGLQFAVNPSVLIPRPETEELVDWIIKDYKEASSNLKNPQIRILDIGTGSGCIAISLAKNLPNTEIYALDVAPEIIALAKKNSKYNKCKINFIELDILSIDILPYKFDIIVSNPPYVQEQEKDQMPPNVIKNEPHLALFVKNENPLIFYDKISDLAKLSLNSKGTLYFEINQYLGENMISLLKSKGFKDIELRKDIFGVDRTIRSIKK
jgi:release factor glutamine methyltransferase